jgi:hypothetical protein
LKAVNLTPIQRKLDRCLESIRNNERGSERLALAQLHDALSMLLDELSRLAPEHPEVTEAGNGFPDF